MDELDSMIKALQKLSDPTRLSSELATAASPYVLQAMKKTLSAGMSPEGEYWAATKEGGRAYAHAADKVTVTPNGVYIGIQIKGPEAFANSGVKGHLPKRQMLPEGGSIPSTISDALMKGADVLLAKWGVTR